MNHLSEEELTQAYYGDEEPESGRHLAECAECQAAFQYLKALLDELLAETVPERGAACFRGCRSKNHGVCGSAGGPLFLCWQAYWRWLSWPDGSHSRASHQ